MSTFRATPDDLADLVRYQQSVALRRAMAYPLGALAVGVLALWVDRMLAIFAFGAATAWGYSAFQETRAVRSAATSRTASRSCA